MLERIRALHTENYAAYGTRRVWKALLREGPVVGRERVRRLTREAGLAGAERRGEPWRTTVPDPGAQRAPDRVDLQFVADAPDRLRVRTSRPCGAGRDRCSSASSSTCSHAGSWAGSSRAHMRTDLVLDALRMALAGREHGADVELVFHSDAGSQYTSFSFTQELKDHRVLASIGSVGDAYDNAMAESFVDTCRTELIADRVWRTRSQLELAIVERVGWDNHRRLHGELGDVPPTEYEDTRRGALSSPRRPQSAQTRFPETRPNAVSQTQHGSRQPLRGADVGEPPSPFRRAAAHSVVR